jgi:hypothetical protein
MILDYYGVVITQEQIVARSFHMDPRGRLPDLGGTFELISRNLNSSGVDLTGRRYHVDAKFGRGAPRPVVLLDELSAQFPVLLCYRTQGSGHVVVATGASYVPGFDGPIVESLVVRDPWPSPENQWNLGRAEYRGADLASQITAHWLIRVM